MAVPEPTEKALRYYHSGIVFWLVDIAWGLLIPCVFLFTGFSARLRTFAARVGRRWYFTVALYLVLFALLGFLIDFPLSYYEDFVRQHAYGMSNQTFGKWMGDALKELGVAVVLNVLLGWIPFFFLKKTPGRWWLYTGLLSVPFFCLALLVGPLWIAPLFNDFGPMKDKGLETQILSLADRAGIEGGRVFEVNKSVDTKAVNAYVTGLGATKRIVLWDTIIAKLEPRELLTVMGHEMGHYVLGHVPQLHRPRLRHRPPGLLHRPSPRGRPHPALRTDVRVRPALRRRGPAPAAPPHERRPPGHHARSSSPSRATRSTKGTDSASRSPTTTTRWRPLS